MTIEYFASWVSDEIAGATRPNIVSGFAADDAGALALAGSLDAHISGDQTSVTKVIGGNRVRSALPVYGPRTVGLMLQDANGVAEHLVVRGATGDVLAAINAYLLAHPGQITLFNAGTAAVSAIGAHV
jgi:hypothetical protein